LVYAPCKKLAGCIELTDQLETDLGFAGESRILLASKTNYAFDLETPNNLTTLETFSFDTVEDHVLAICKKLLRTGRLIS
jgi:hypothetical protein